MWDYIKVFHVVYSTLLHGLSCRTLTLIEYNTLLHELHTNCVRLSLIAHLHCSYLHMVLHPDHIDSNTTQIYYYTISISLECRHIGIEKAFSTIVNFSQCILVVDN